MAILLCTGSHGIRQCDRCDPLVQQPDSSVHVGYWSSCRRQMPVGSLGWWMRSAQKPARRGRMLVTRRLSALICAASSHTALFNRVRIRLSWPWPPA
ncbi:hypothetical protein MLPM_0574 [Mycobacterium lepromatosis]|uniref:Uncharacterized protein n=1 Tax=Mycobacterium lepromatosis TaxID=480418 RepID=A0A0F4ESK9_9MYCO|nr:hypothetical protein MLPM_0574 [Mycobacterium lepromatosis]